MKSIEIISIVRMIINDTGLIAALLLRPHDKIIR